MRDTSSRSLTSRTRWLICRSITWRARIATGSWLPAVFSRCTAFRSGARGLRSSCPRVARNSSLRWSARRSDSSARPRSARCSRIWYCRARARRAVRTAVTSVASRTGRSSSVTLPRVRTASFESAESAPGRVRISTGRSDQAGCAASTVRSDALWEGEAASSGSRIAPAPAVTSSMSCSNDWQTSRRIPSGDNMATVVAASFDVAARNNSRRSRAWSSVTRGLCPAWPTSRDPRRWAPR